ncbi:MAG: hypothetical protein ACI3WQ_06640 [Faecousia sp.]
MKKWNKWYLASGILQLLCCIHILLEWLCASNALTAVPFSLRACVSVIGFGIPAAICFLIGFHLEKKRKDDSHENGN